MKINISLSGVKIPKTKHKSYPIKCSAGKNVGNDDWTELQFDPSISVVDWRAEVLKLWPGAKFTSDKKSGHIAFVSTQLHSVGLWHPHWGGSDELHITVEVPGSRKVRPEK